MKNLNEVIKELEAVRAIAQAKTKVDVHGALIEKSVLYARAMVGGKSGSQSLIKTSDSEADGVRNIDNAKLPTGEAFLVTGIAISTGSCSGKPTDEAELSKVPFERSIENSISESFTNSELSIKAGKKEKFKTILRHVMQQNASDDTFEDSAHTVTPFVIDPQQSIEFDLNIFDAVAKEVNDSAIEVALIGFRITANNA